MQPKYSAEILRSVLLATATRQTNKTAAAQITRRALLASLARPTGKATGTAVAAAKQAPKAVKYMDEAADLAVKSPTSYATFNKGNAMAAGYLARNGTGGAINKAVDAIVPDNSMTTLLFNNKHIPTTRRTLLKLMGLNAVRGRKAIAKSVFMPDDRRLYAAHRLLNRRTLSGLEPMKLGNTALLLREVAPPKFLTRNKKRLLGLGVAGLGGGGAYEVYETLKSSAENKTASALTLERDPSVEILRRALGVKTPA